MTGSIAGEHSWVYIWDKETKHDHFSGSLAMRAFRRGHLLYHPAQWYEAGYLRNRALDLVELRARNVGHNYRGQPGLATSDPSKLVGFSSFTAALLLFAQLTTNFGLIGHASSASRTISNLGRDDPAQFRGPRQGTGNPVLPVFSARGVASSMQRRRREQGRSAFELTRAAT
jgi:hypothetical protein